VYWQNADGLVVSVKATGGDRQVGTAATPLANNPRCGIVVRDDELWTTAYGLGQIIHEGTPHVPYTGFVMVYGQFESPSSIAVDDDFAYVTEFTAGRVSKLSNDGNVQTTLATGLAQPDRIVVDAQNIYFIEHGSTKDAVDGTVKAIPKAGGDPVTLAKDLVGVGDITLSAGRLYYSTQGNVFTIDLSSALGSSPSEAFAGGIHLLGPIAADGQNVFWPDYVGIHRAAIPGGGEGELLERNVMVVALAIDDTRAFWSDGENINVVAKFK
jgi:hypothetical protein